jgi:hypothetical protein
MNCGQHAAPWREKIQLSQSSHMLQSSCSRLKNINGNKGGGCYPRNHLNLLNRRVALMRGRMELDGSEHAVSAESTYRHAYSPAGRRAGLPRLLAQREPKCGRRRRSGRASPRFSTAPRATCARTVRRADPAADRARAGLEVPREVLIAATRPGKRHDPDAELRPGGARSLHLDTASSLRKSSRYRGELQLH